MKSLQQQQGVVLIVALIFLVLITLVSVSSMKTTVLEERMAGNYKDKSSAFQAAEAALRGAEEGLANNTYSNFDGTQIGLHRLSENNQQLWLSIDWDEEVNPQYLTYGQNLQNISSEPKFIIEEMEPVLSLDASEAVESEYYRITSQAVGNTESAQVTLQSTYKVSN